MNTFRFIFPIITPLNIMRKQGIHFIYRTFIEPKSTDEDTRRKEFILNIILSGSLAILLLLDISILISQTVNGAAYRGIPFGLFSCVVAVNALLLILSRKGFLRLSSYTLLSLYFVLTMFGVYQWSLVLPMIILGAVMVIVISSILISIRFSFIAALFVIGGIVTITYLQVHDIIPVHLYWKTLPLKIKDATEISVIFFLITVVSWLSNREVERSLIRARKSEAALTEERNLLEIKVEERTREIKQLQMEKVSQLYRTAEFGKLSSGIFHDLMNPLNAVIANVGQLESRSQPEAIAENLPEVKQYLQKAVTASRRMGDFLGTIRKQIHPSQNEAMFSLNKELSEAIDILQHKARVAHVTLKIKDSKELETFGNPLKFHQLALNLISNAIDAYDGMVAPEESDHVIHITLAKRDANALLRVTDYGCGISDETKSKMFETFFTTKSNDKGMGIGLSTVKSIVEKDFKGTIRVESIPGKGASFEIIFKLNPLFANH